MRTAGLRLDRAPQLDLPLRFFLAAPLFAVAAGVLLLLQGATALTTPWAPQTIALTHLITLGALTTTMLGALFQLMPVVLGSEVPGGRWSRRLHPLYLLAVVGLVGGLLFGSRTVLVVAWVLLAVTLLPLLGQQAACLARAGGRGHTVLLLRLALAAFAGTIALGLVFVAGHAFAWWPLPRAAALPVHVYWSLGGWVGGLIAGVGIAVLPMFYIAPPIPGRASGAVIAALCTMLLAAPVVFATATHRAWMLLPLAVGAVALGAFTVAFLRLLRSRRRKVADASLRFWQGGLAAAWLALVFAALHTAQPHPRWLLAFGVLYLAGFALSVLSGMLYRIVPFLVWTHRFAGLAGSAPIPMMSDLLPRTAARRQQACHGAAVLLLTAAALVPLDALVRVAGLTFALSGAYLWRNLLHAARFQPATAEGPAAAAPAREASGSVASSP